MKAKRMVVTLTFVVILFGILLTSYFFIYIITVGNYISVEDKVVNVTKYLPSSRKNYDFNNISTIKYSLYVLANKHLLNETTNKDYTGNLALTKFLFNNSFRDHEARTLVDTKLVGIESSSVSQNKQSTLSSTRNDEHISQNNDHISQNLRNPQDDIEIVGELKGQNYVVFSSNTDSRDSISFIFYLPLTALAWKRVGFNSLIVIVGSKIIWNSDPLLSYVLEQLYLLKAVILFLESRANISTMLSQVSRIYAGNIIFSHNNSTGEIYLVTTDADIWPIRGKEYILPNNKVILSHNAECCAPFKHRGRIYRMLPMSNVGMKIKHWYQLTNHFSISPSTVDEILTQAVREFGSVVLRPTHKGENVGWYLDQMLISIFIAKWADNHPNHVKYTSRNTNLDRIDRNAWIVPQTISDKLDAHLPSHGYRPQVWKEIVPLLQQLLGKDSKEFRYCNSYHKQFTRTIEENGIP